jgi:hypothetical protein
LPRRPVPKTLELLRTVLTKLEETHTRAEDQESMSELKRVLLNRIADVEFSQRLEISDTANDWAPESADLTAVPSAMEEGRLEAGMEERDQVS